MGKKRAILFLTGVVLLLMSLLIGLVFIKFVMGVRDTLKRSAVIKSVREEKIKVTRFDSVDDFKEYLEEGGESLGAGWGRGGPVSLSLEAAVPAGEIGQADSSLKNAAAGAQRVSETNVQVKGIDEPDILKTDGKNLFYSSRERMIGGILREGTSFAGVEDVDVAREAPVGDLMPTLPSTKGKVSLVNAFPPEEMKQASEIDKEGEMLWSGGVLTIFSNKKIYGFNVEDPAAPKEEWTMELKDNTAMATARLHEGKVYLVTKTAVNRERPCPIEPLLVKGETLEVKCGDIYHPVTPVPIDITYEVIVFDAKSGTVEKTVSFVGSELSENVYMSEEAIYVAYDYPEDTIKFMVEFLRENKDLVGDRVLERLEKLEGYELSDAAKMAEFSSILENFKTALNNDERLKFDNEMANRSSDYAKKHLRQYQKTGIAKIGVKSLEVEASGAVPGSLLNQFSLDEYEGNLRVATTVGGGWIGGFGFNGRAESVNDVYVLNKKLDIVGVAQDLGAGERIYSARFLGERGYLVTFKQIDPFFVMDLSDPKNPKVKGELKIPGYSSYLHPIGEARVLGIGKEEGRVKLSLFNVKSAESPAEESKYLLEEGWSEALGNHHAFLLDEKHEVFFMPGSRGGYVFSYAGGELKLVKAVANINAKRGLYLDDYLYIAGEGSIKVFDESNWEEVKELELGE